MAVAVANSVRTGLDWPSSNTRTQSVDCTGSDRLLLACTFTNSTSSAQVVNSATYNGDAMTALTAGVHASNWRWRLFYLIAPDTGTNNVVFTYGDGNAQWAIMAAQLTGVAQDSPIRGGTVVNASGADANATFTVSSAANDLVVAMWRLYTGNRAITEGSGTTSIFGTASSALFTLTEPGDTSTVINCTWTSSEDWGGAAVSVTPTASATKSPAHRTLLFG
jgi:hypothetical protein